MKKVTILITLLWAIPSFAQNISVTEVTKLSNTVKESSGLLSLSGLIITFNDSGGKAELYEIDTANGKITRTVTIKNATNTDWEAICKDDSFIYIGDFGNNQGARKNLKVYRVAIDDYLNNSSDTVNAETIAFSYADQTDFTPKQYSTNYDAEAFLAFGDSLFIFTKNWGNEWTNLYGLPKKPGTFKATRIDSLNSQGLVTDATYNDASQTLVLLGYKTIQPFIIKITGFSGTQFFSGISQKINLTFQSFAQTEGICPLSKTKYLVSSEGNQLFDAAIFRFKFDKNVTGGLHKSEAQNVFVYPNPVTGYLFVSILNPVEIRIYDMNGKLVIQSEKKIIDVSSLQSGKYTVKIGDKNGKLLASENIIIE